MKKLLLILLTLTLGFGLAIAQVTVTGKILDENGTPLPGAVIKEINTNNGTISDINGDFTLTVSSANAQLQISFVGYETKVINLNGQTTLTVTLVPSNRQLDEVVVMGYSNKMRSEIASAVTTLNSKDVLDVTTNDVGSMLQGKVAGVQVVQSSGAPGAGAQVRIRGISTIKPGNQEPLYVVDGIIGGTFDPNDIESITILKDAGATGMYGARANKGVVIITTKSAKKGKITFNVRTSVGLRMANHGNLKMMNGEQFFEYSKELYRDPETHEIDLIRFYQDYPAELKDRNFDWVNTVFQKVPVQNYYISASGGTEKNAFMFSTSYYDGEGTFLGTYFKRLNVRLNQSIKPNNRFSFKHNLNVSFTKNGSYDYMDMYYSFLMIPWDYGLDSAGNPVYIDANTPAPDAIPEGRWWSRDKINPLHTMVNSDYHGYGASIDYDFIVEYKIFDWLTFQSSNRLSFSTSKFHSFVSPLAAGTYHDKGWVSEQQENWVSGISTNLFKFYKKIGKHTLNGLVGIEGEQGYSDNLSAEGKGLPLGFSVPSVASSELSIGGSYDIGAMESFISQVSYDYDKRYFLTASYRIDASSNFPPTHRVAKFPTVSASWLISNEPFMVTNNAIKMLKLRASFGVTGDPDIGASRYLGLFSLSSQYNSLPAALPSQLANYDLTWERTFEKNIGLDLSLTRFNMSLDVYDNVTKDLIVLVAQPLSVGFESRWENRGEVTNTGIELSMDGDIIRTKNLYWNVNFAISYNKNVLSGIDQPFYRTLNGISQVYRDGGEIYTFVLPKWLGVDTATGAPLWEKVVYDDNGNVISREPTSNYAEATPQEVGSALPKIIGGFGTSFSYRRFSVFASFAYQYGNLVYNFTRVFMDNDGHEPYYNAMVPKPSWSRWTKPGDIATHPSMQNAALSSQVSSRYLEDGSFLKVREISILYDVPVEKLHFVVKSLEIGFRVENPKVFTPFWGQDPEVTLYQRDWSMPGVLDFKYPNNAQYVFNVNLKF